MRRLIRFFRQLTSLVAFLLVLPEVARADSLPWLLLEPVNDTRDAEMQAWDRLDSLNFVEVANRSEAFAGQRFHWAHIPVTDVLKANTPFAELRFDPVKPMEFTGREKTTLREWFTRGGFLLLFEDAYPYTQEAFRKNTALPVYDFFTRELPALDPKFTVERITDDHPIFHIRHRTATVPSVAREMRENPHYRGRTLILHDGRPAAFFMGRYSFESNNRWVPMPRPFSKNYSSELKSYHLIVNIYVYAMVYNIARPSTDAPGPVTALPDN